jgi:hypothetical protein
LIELVTRAAWIRNVGGLDAPLTPRARALCVELGIAKALKDEVNFLATKLGIPFPSGTIENSRYLADFFDRLHKNDNCSCGGSGRTSSDTQRTLRALVNAPAASRLGSATLLYGLWKTYSRSVHHPRLEYLAADVPGGAAYEPASVPDRAVWLYNLLLPYSFLALSAASAYTSRSIHPSPQRDIGFSARFLGIEIRQLAQLGY